MSYAWRMICIISFHRQGHRKRKRKRKKNRKTSVQHLRPISTSRKVNLVRRVSIANWLSSCRRLLLIAPCIFFTLRVKVSGHSMGKIRYLLSTHPIDLFNDNRIIYHISINISQFYYVFLCIFLFFSYLALDHCSLLRI